MRGPGDDGVEHDCGAVGLGVLVVAGGQTAPLLGVAVAAFNDVAAAVGVGIELRWPAAG